MSFRRTRAMAQKEFRHILRDPRSLGMALGMPLVMLLLFGSALSLDVDRIPTLVFDADRTDRSRELIQRFAGSRFFEVRGIVDNYGVIEKQIDQNKILLGVAIPRNYSQNLASGQNAEVQLLLDGSDSNTASIALGYAESLTQSYGAEVRADAQNRGAGLGSGSTRIEPAVDAQLRVWYNSSLESKNYVIPGITAVILMIIAALLTSLTIAREWEMGTMEQLLSTPVRPSEMVLGKMLAFFAVGLVDTVITIAAGVFLFKVPLRGNVLLLMGTSCIFLFGALCWGIFISAVARTQLLAYQMGILSSFLPSFLLSGFIYAIDSMPLPIQMFTRLVPARYFVTILKGIFLKGVGLNVLWAETGFLIAFGVAVFFLATRKLKQKMV